MILSLGLMGHKRFPELNPAEDLGLHGTLGDFFLVVVGVKIEPYMNLMGLPASIQCVQWCVCVCAREMKEHQAALRRRQ